MFGGNDTIAKDKCHWQEREREMRPLNWTTYGFWLAIGLALGMLVSNVTAPRAAMADSASSHGEYCMVSGASFDKEIDLIWLLDYKYAYLHCIVLNRSGQLNTLGQINLKEQLQIEEGQRIKPHFMMVTGRFNTRGTDYCYLTEIETGQILCIEPPNVAGAQRGQAQIPRVVSRFRFRPEGD